MEHCTVINKQEHQNNMESSDDDSSDSNDPLDLIQAGAASTPKPTSFRQSQQRSDADLSQKACEEEMEAHRLNGTWEIVKLTPGKRAIGSRWFMKVKHSADGSLNRATRPGWLPRAILSALALISRRPLLPLFGYSTIHIVLSLAALEDLELSGHFSCLNGTLEEEIYMMQAKGFEVRSPDHVCKLVQVALWPEASWQGLEQDPSLCTLLYGLQLHPIGPWALYLSER